MKIINCVLIAAAALAAPAFGQTNAGAPPDTMQILREKMKADKKLVVAANMDLTEAEATGFWPIYEDLQKELHKINDQMATLIAIYAGAYNKREVTDARAMQLVDEALAIEDAELKLKRSMVTRLAKVLPGLKVARYVQIENKIRALVKYEIAGEVPLVK